MKNDEISIFKIQFASEDQNFYMTDEISTKFLTEEIKEKITDKTVMFIKIKVQSILRDIKDVSAIELKKLKNSPLEFIQDRIKFGVICKEHAKVALTEKSLNDALKLYRKGLGAIKMISKDVIKNGREEIKLSKNSEGGEFEDILMTLNGVKIQLMLNQGFCHWKKQEWEKMKKINSEIIQNFDENNIKALYRLAFACKELKNYDEGLVRYFKFNLL